MWWRERQVPELALGSMPTPLVLDGPLDVGALERALQILVDRHEVLRTRFPLTAEGPVQEILPAHELTLPTLDLFSRSADRREAELRAVVDEDAATPFHLESDPPVRAKLVRIDAYRHCLALNVHHIACDSWSIKLLFAELAQLYELVLGGREIALPPPPLHYADYAVWQRAGDGKTAEDDLRFWRGRLRELPEAYDLPLTAPRPPKRSFRGAIHYFEVPGDAAARLRELAAGQGMTPFMAMLAVAVAWARGVARSDDVVITTTVANRPTPDQRAIVGYFTNIVPIRVDTRDDPAFVHLLPRVRAELVEAFLAQQTPFERIVELAAEASGTAPRSLGQIMFAYDNSLAAPIVAGDLTIRPLEGGDPGVSNRDLTLLLDEREAAVAGLLFHDTDVLDASTAAELADRFQSTLRAVLRDPSARLSAIVAG